MKKSTADAATVTSMDESKNMSAAITIKAVARATRAGRRCTCCLSRPC